MPFRANAATIAYRNSGLILRNYLPKLATEITTVRANPTNSTTEIYYLKYLSKFILPPKHLKTGEIYHFFTMCSMRPEVGGLGHAAKRRPKRCGPLPLPRGQAVFGRAENLKKCTGLGMINPPPPPPRTPRYTELRLKMSHEEC